MWNGLYYVQVPTVQPKGYCELEPSEMALRETEKEWIWVSPIDPKISQVNIGVLDSRPLRLNLYQRLCIDGSRIREIFWVVLYHLISMHDGFTLLYHILLQGKIQYNIVGVYPAQDFSISLILMSSESRNVLDKTASDLTSTLYFSPCLVSNHYFQFWSWNMAVLLLHGSRWRSQISQKTKN